MSAKPNLADLAKINLGPSNFVKNVGSSITRPSLSDLARGNLQPSNLVGGHPFQRPSLNEHQTCPPGNISSGGNFNLALALRNKCSLADERKAVLIEKISENLPILLKDSRALDMTLISSQASPLGRVIVTSGLSTTTLFPRYKQPVVGPNSSVKLKPFDFTSPSPDDLIRSRLRV